MDNLLDTETHIIPQGTQNVEVEMVKLSKQQKRRMNDKKKRESENCLTFKVKSDHHKLREMPTNLEYKHNILQGIFDNPEFP